MARPELKNKPKKVESGASAPKIPAKTPALDKTYDTEKLYNMVELLGVLRGFADDSKIPEIIMMIDAVYNLTSATVYAISRYQMTEFPPAT